MRFSVPDGGVIHIGEKDEVTIIDEFDHVMLDRAAKFSKNVGRWNKVIGLTATHREYLSSIEIDYLENWLKFKFFDSKIKPS